MEDTGSLVDGERAGKVIFGQLVLLLPEVDGAESVPSKGGGGGQKVVHVPSQQHVEGKGGREGGTYQAL